MRIAIAVAVTLVAAGAAAQQSDTPQRRAPLANVEDLEPAVDVSAPRVALAAPPAAPAVTPPTGPTVSTPPVAEAEPARSTPDRPVPRVMDSLDLGTTSITGNAELPKVLYIVPWKKSDLGDLVGRPVNTLLDEVLAPVDPEVFQRHLSYYETLHGGGQEE
jgi:hypothetical protein